MEYGIQQNLQDRFRLRKDNMPAFSRTAGWKDGEFPVRQDSKYVRPLFGWRGALTFWLSALRSAAHKAELRVADDLSMLAGRIK
jgi:hypothetical protein